MYPCISCVFVVKTYFVRRARWLILCRSYWRWGDSATVASSGKKSISCSFRSSPATYTGGEGVVFTMVVGYCDTKTVWGGGLGWDAFGGGMLTWASLFGTWWCHQWRAPSATSIVVAAPVLATCSATYTAAGLQKVIDGVAGFGVWWFGMAIRWRADGRYGLAMVGITYLPTYLMHTTIHHHHSTM